MISCRQIPENKWFPIEIAEKPYRETLYLAEKCCFFCISCQISCRLFSSSRKEIIIFRTQISYANMLLLKRLLFIFLIVVIYLDYNH